MLVPLSFGLEPSACPLRAKYQRPRLKVHGAWAFGYQLSVAVMDETARHDSSSIIEILATTVEDAAWNPIGFETLLEVMRIAREERRPIPTCLLINATCCYR